MKRYALLLLFTLLLAGCDVQWPMADQKFARQHFVSAVSMIELHHTRYGSYPQSLDELQFLGDWDAIWLSAVRYEKQPKGYNLFLSSSWSGNEVTLQFPVAFKQGLGIVHTNVQWTGN